MKAETFSLMVRHGLTAVGPWLMMATPVTESEWDQAVGLIATLAGLGWSWWRKWSRANA